MQLRFTFKITHNLPESTLDLLQKPTNSTASTTAYLRILLWFGLRSLCNGSQRQFGDQVISVNEVDFTNITHDEAVAMLQSSPRMSMVVRSVGKVPHSTLPYASNNAGASSSSEPWYPESMPHRSE
ncbi:hypothetical protein AVEN_126082-1 [Araneus ventricosus]|uniref:PDZ domain-containing protein n=1 Tax=Araneus ventricosus TaxID=182803 RepID=A0A4Y2CL90_ARAVE|nr:hypothetical protein AVEN_126082-1 [Araneus ventricosus]